MRRREMRKAMWTGLALLCALLVGPKSGRAEDILTTMVHGSLAKSLPLLQSSAATFSEKSGCLSCHHQFLPAMTLAMARERGVAFDEKRAQAQMARITGDLEKLRPLLEQAPKDKVADTKLTEALVEVETGVGFMLATLNASKVQPNAATEAAALVLAARQWADGHWPSYFARPPMTGSEVTTTALAIRSLRAYMPQAKASEAKRRIEKARLWLTKQPCATTEDKVYRLFGLKWADADTPSIQRATEALLAEQRDNGGWAQLPTLGSDAYATGQTLVALHEAGGMPTTNPALTRGAAFLAGTQREDGSWFVQSRTTPFVPYFESGFPHEKSQFIACAATSWATMALLQTVTAPAAPRVAAR